MTKASHFFLVFVASTCATLAQARADCKADLEAVIANTKTAGPYHQVTTITSGATTMNMQGNVILPDQFDITMPQGRMIMSKKGTWMQRDGKWMKMPDAMRKMVGNQVGMAGTQSMKNVTNLKCLGNQTYDGASYTAFDFDSSATVMGIASTSHATMYVSDGKPAVVIVDGQAMGRKSHTVQKITYDPSLKITEPK